MDHNAPLTLLQAGFSFGDILIQTGAIAVAGFWACVPFSLFGVRRRLDGISEAQRDHAEALTQELRRFRELATNLPPSKPRTAPRGAPESVSESMSQSAPSRRPLPAA